MRHMTALKSGLGALVVLCVGLRVLAWLVAPVLPVVVVLFVIVTVLSALLFPGRRL